MAIFWAFFHGITLMEIICYGIWSFLLALLEYPYYINLLDLWFHITLIHIAKLIDSSALHKNLLSKNKTYKEFFRLFIAPFNTPSNYFSILSIKSSLGFASRCMRRSLLKIITWPQVSHPQASFRKNLCTLHADNSRTNFLEWFCGLTDGEGNFYIRRRNLNTAAYSFKFSIGTHIDDVDMLNFIQSTLKIGKVYTTGKVAQYEVYDIKGVQKIIEIFTQHPLNSTKLLNFLDFKRAFELYKGPNGKSSEVIQEIANIKQGMNSTRINFEMPKGHQPRITPYWLLGFVEGEASFNVIKGFNLTFSIAQSSIDSVLMEAIKSYLNCLPGSAKYIQGESVVYLGTFTGSSQKEMTRITVSQLLYIKSVLIPFFSDLVWRSKKFLDFQDWLKILELRDRCHQYEEEGKVLMDLIVSQMNNNRLSTNKSPQVDRALLYTSIDKLLGGPSNCEIKDGKVWIKSLNRFRRKGGLIKPVAVQLQDQKGDIIRIFDTQVDCAKCLGVTRTTVARWLEEGKPTLFEDRVVFITKVEVKEEE